MIQALHWASVDWQMENIGAVSKVTQNTLAGQVLTRENLRQQRSASHKERDAHGEMAPSHLHEIVEDNTW